MDLNVQTLLESLLKKPSDAPLATPDQSPYMAGTINQSLEQLVRQLAPLVQTNQIPLVPITLPDERFNMHGHSKTDSMGGMDDFVVPLSEELNVLVTPIDNLDSPMQSSHASSSASLEQSLIALNSFLSEQQSKPTPGMRMGALDEFIHSVTQEPRFSGELATLLEPLVSNPSFLSAPVGMGVLRDARESLDVSPGGVSPGGVSPRGVSPGGVSPRSLAGDGQSDYGEANSELDNELMEQFDKL